MRVLVTALGCRLVVVLMLVAVLAPVARADVIETTATFVFDPIGGWSFDTGSTSGKFWTMSTHAHKAVTKLSKSAPNQCVIVYDNDMRIEGVATYYGVLKISKCR